MVLLDVLVPSTLAGFLIYMPMSKHMQWEVGIYIYQTIRSAFDADFCKKCSKLISII